MATIGIDLGTTTSEAAICSSGKPRILRDQGGNEIVLSVVGINPKTKEIIIGESAKNQLIGEPEYTVEEIKRLMGSDSSVKLGNIDYRPEEISAILLRKIAEYAAAHLNEEVDRAVITVPANFNDKQRSATKIAGEMAGLVVERIINEPTAAALSFGVESSDDGKTLVYDLGGGTFDVTVLDLASGVLDVKASAGDNHLGGQDFDRALADRVCEEFLSTEGIDLRGDSDAFIRIRHACETAKKDLSFTTTSTINVPFITSRDGKPLSLSVEVSRSDFESLLEPYLARTEKAIDKALRRADCEIGDIDNVLLVGGSTRIPAVRELVERKMRKKPRTDVDPDRAVALGAAVQASIIDGESSTIIMDVCPLSLGTSVVSTINGQRVSGLYSEVLPANSPQLKACKESYHTVYDNQTAVEIDVFQKDSMSESIWCRDHTLLHSHTAEGIPEGPAGDQEITLTYTYNLNGILDVEVCVCSTGISENFSVETNLRRDVDSSNIDELIEQSEITAGIRATIHVAEKKIAELGCHEELEKKLMQLKQASVEEDSTAVKRLDEQITDILFDLE